MVVVAVTEQVKIRARSAVHKRQFIRACDSAGETMTEVLQRAMDEFIAKHTVGTDPESLERQAIELEQKAEEHRADAQDHDSEREQALSDAKDAQHKADQLRQEASELRESKSSFHEDVEELLDLLFENPELRVFADHAKVLSIAKSHDKNPNEVLKTLVDIGLSESRVLSGV
jgi:chromosome segregation ATPase